MRKATSTRMSSGLVMMTKKGNLDQQIARTARNARKVRVQLTAKVHRASEVYWSIVLLTGREKTEWVATS